MAIRYRIEYSTKVSIEVCATERHVCSAFLSEVPRTANGTHQKNAYQNDLKTDAVNNVHGETVGKQRLESTHFELLEKLEKLLSFNNLVVVVFFVNITNANAT